MFLLRFRRELTLSMIRGITKSIKDFLAASLGSLDNSCYRKATFLL
jgi:hypothetical protein